MAYTRLFSREYSVQYADCCMRMASTETKPHTPMVIQSCAYIPDNQNEVFCIETGEWNRFKDHVFKKWSTKKQLHQFVQNFHWFGKNLFPLPAKLVACRFERLHQKQLFVHTKNTFAFLCCTRFTCGPA